MRPEFETYSEIDSYLNNQLSEQDNRAFEQKMHQDPAFKELVFDRKVMHEIIIENRFFNITNTLRKTPPAYQSLFSNTVKRFLGIGAAISVILFTPYYFVQQSTKKTPPTNYRVEETKEETSPTNIKEENSEKNGIALDTNTAITPVIESPVLTEEKPVAKTGVKKSSPKKVDKSYIVEIPIDDPSASTTKQVHTFSFSPSKGETWTIPLKKASHGNLKVFNQEGTEVFAVVAEKEGTNNWNGHSNQGLKLKPGKYLYVLDFGNGHLEHGHVVINP